MIREDPKLTNDPPIEREHYELIVQFQGDRVSMCDFAREIASEFGCEVVVNQVDDDGMVISGLVDWETIGVPHD